MANYYPCVVYADGILLFENQSVNVEHPESGERVPTIPGGFQGRSSGPKGTNVALRNAVPRAGVDYDFAKRWKEDADLKLRIIHVSSGRELNGDFNVVTCSVGGEVGAPVLEEASLESIGPDAPIFESA